MGYLFEVENISDIGHHSMRQPFFISSILVKLISDVDPVGHRF